MKTFPFFTFAALLIITSACGQSFDDNTYYEDEYYSEYSAPANDEYQQGAYQAQQVSHTSQSNRNNDIKIHSVRDPKTGAVTSTIPLPADWKITPQAIKGPNGIEAQELPGTPMNGRTVQSVDQIINSYIKPQLRNYGSKILNTTNLPEIAQRDQYNYNLYWSSMPCQKSAQAKSIEVQNPDGTLGIIVVHLLSSRSQYGNFDFYYCSALGAPRSSYESAKKAYLYGLANIQMDRQYLAAHNQREQQKSQASWAAHNNKMRRNQDNFNAWNQAQKTRSEVSDILHDTWKNTNASSDRMQEMTVDGIWDREATTNPYSGEQTKVESGYKYYYMNQFGEYIGTNDAFYNPAQDPNVNNQDWRKVQSGGGGY